MKYYNSSIFEHVNTIEFNPWETLAMNHLKVLDGTIWTAGGRISCPRCLALSVRTKVQCKKPALKTSRTQKCATHGGRGHTSDALARIAKAHTSHGQTTKAAKVQSRMDSAMLREYEDAMHFLGIAQGPKTRGRKPAGYKPVRTQADLVRMFKERCLHTV